MWKLLLICIVMSALYTEGDAASSGEYSEYLIYISYNPSQVCLVS